MRILIVGAGLGGLSAAICFARKGHDVEVLEHKDRISPAGSGLNIRPPASKIMHTWGLRQDLESISEATPAVVYRSLQTGAVTLRTVAADVADSPDWSTQRSILIELLGRRAREAGAVLTFNATVTEVGDDAEKAVAVLASGTQLEADLILAADGIRSRLRPQILHDVPGSTDPVLSDLTLYGMRLPQEKMLSFPGLKPLMDQNYLNVFMGHNSWVVTKYNGKLRSQGVLFGIKGDTDQQAMWDEKGDVGYVRGFFKDSCTELKKFLEVVPSCDRWKLAEIPDLPRWTSRAGRVLLLGDSAHAMHPNAAHGFSQIVEDIGVLEYLISETTEPALNVPTVTAHWQEIRKARVERIKAWARFNSAFFTGKPATESKDPNDQWQVSSLEHTKADMDAHFNSKAFVKWAQSYDAVDEAQSAYNRHVSYCRRSQGKPKKRNRSCKACHSAKSKCSFEPECSRCRSKGLQCVYEKPLAPTTATSEVSGFELGVPDFETLVSGDRHDDIMRLNFAAVDAVSVPQLTRAHGMAPTPTNNEHAILSFGSSMNLLDPASAIGSPRSIANLQGDPVAQHSATFLLESIRGLPRMLTKRETFPWFIHSHHWHESGVLPETIAKCVEMAQIYVDRDAGSATTTGEGTLLLWPVVDAESRRLLKELNGDDDQPSARKKEDVLSGMQAQMVYMVMCAMDNISACGIPEVRLQMLMSFEMYCKKCFALDHGRPLVVDEHADRDVTWEDWIYAETRRRCAISWFLLSRVVDVKFGVLCSSIAGYRALLLPCPGALWNARTRVDWEKEEAVRQARVERVGPSLRTFGDLVDARSCPQDPELGRQLDEWHAGCDKLGLLLTLATTMV